MGKPFVHKLKKYIFLFSSASIAFPYVEKTHFNVGDTDYFKNQIPNIRKNVSQIIYNY